MGRFECALIDFGANAEVLASTLQLLEFMPEVTTRQVTLAEANSKPSHICIVAFSSPYARNLLECVQRLRGRDANRPIVLLGDELPFVLLSELLRGGAADFIRLPLSGAELCARVERALGVTPQHHEPTARVPSWIDDATLLTRNLVFQRTLAHMPALAGSGADLLVRGEAGTGRRPAIAMVLRLAYLSRIDTIDAELLSPDEVEVRLGELLRDLQSQPEDTRAAIVIHDVDRLSPWAQGLLLRALQWRDAHQPKVRLIASAGHSLAMLRSAGHFSAALAQRLEPTQLLMPELRRRREDIIALAHHFLSSICAAVGRNAPSLTPSACSRLITHTWPGNLRELRAVLDRAITLAGNGPIGATHLTFERGQWVQIEEHSLQQVKLQLVVSFERSFLEQLLRSCEGNIAKAARMARKNRRALFELLRKHDIDPEEFRPPTVRRSYPSEEPGAHYDVGTATA